MSYYVNWYLDVVDLFKVSVYGAVRGVHDEEREGQVEQDECQCVADVASEHQTSALDTTVTRFTLHLS